MDDLISRADALAVVMHSRDPVKDIQMLPGVGWIPVEECLPEEHDFVIIAAADGEVLYGSIFKNRYSRTGYAAYDGDSGYFNHVTHWIPLPEPPKEGK